jgi:hypothetical protein
VKTILLTALAAGLAAYPGWTAEYELKWDTGKVRVRAVFTEGLGSWYANDFDVSTLRARHIDRVKIMSTGYYINGRWDGFRIAIFDFDTSPGSIIWPESREPKYVVGSGENPYEWCEFDVGWTLPRGHETFVVGQEQFFRGLACDPYCLDDDEVFRLHTWYKMGIQNWRLRTSGTGANLMLRVILRTDPAVEPASLGRVKALFR